MVMRQHHRGWGHDRAPFTGLTPHLRMMWGLLGRGPRARRGDVRCGVLALLAEQPRNGYQLIQDLEQRSGGVWRPSPGSVYPTLQQLQDEGMIDSEADGTGRAYRLTKQGLAYVKAHPEEMDAPWKVGGAGDDEHRAAHELHRRGHELMKLLHEIGAAAMQVANIGKSQQMALARELLIETRRSLYRILADEKVG